MKIKNPMKAEGFVCLLFCFFVFFFYPSSHSVKNYCLAHNRHSVNLYWLKEDLDGKREYIVSAFTQLVPSLELL